MSHPMNDDDRRLAYVLRDEAERVHPEPDWDDVLRRAEHTPRRRAVLLAAAAAVVVAGVVGAVAVTSPDERGSTEVFTDDPDGPAQPGETTPAPIDSGPSTATTAVVREGPAVAPIPLPTGAPLAADELVAVVERPTGGDPPVLDLVVVSTDDGTVVRTLLAGMDSSEGGIYNLSLSVDRSTLLFAHSLSACESEVRAVAVDGSTPKPVRIGAGNLAVLSPDRSTIALDTRSSCDPPVQIEVLPVAGGSTHLFGEGGAPLAGLPRDVGIPRHETVTDLVFEDDETIVYAVGRSDRSTLHRLDWRTGKLGDIDLGFDRPSYAGLQQHGDGTVTVVIVCCGTGPERRTTVARLVDDSAETVLEISGESGDLDVGLAPAGVVQTPVTHAGELRLDGRVLRTDVLEAIG